MTLAVSTARDEPGGLPATSPEGRPARTSRWRRGVTPYLYVAPFFVVFGCFGLFPLLYTGFLSLHSVDLVNTDHRQWVGLDNYVTLWQDAQFHKAILNTFTIGLMSTVPQLLMALGIAHLLNLGMRGRTLVRVGVLVPYATSVAAASLVFAQLFGRDYGLINWVLQSLGASPVDWEPGRWSSQVAVSVIITWRWTGYNALIYLAGMQSIPADLYEAAAIDGANRWKQFRHVTVPSLRPAIIFTVINSTIGALQIFGEPRLFGNPGAGGIAGGASNQYQTIGLLLYQQGWSFGQLGMASATAYSMFLIIIVVATLNGTLATGRLTRLRRGRGDAR